MAMKKTEMEADASSYHQEMYFAVTAQRQGLQREAVKHALLALPFIDGMMQYERKYKDKAFDSIESIDIVLKYAPLLFDLQSLNDLEALLTAKRTIDRHASADLARDVDQARQRMWQAHHLWNHIERNPDCRQDELRRALGGDQDEWRAMAEAWHAMSLLRRTPAGGSCRLTLSTRLAEVVSAKCPSCGTIVQCPKAFCLETTGCPDCKADGVFVLLAGHAATESET